MPRRTGKVLLDVSHLLGDTRRLYAGLTAGGKIEAHAQAERTATKTRDATPVLTGQLQSTVGVVQTTVTGRGLAGVDTAAWGVTYGGGLPYAGRIERSKHPVRKGARGARQDFTRALDELARREVGRI